MFYFRRPPPSLCHPFAESRDCHSHSCQPLLLTLCEHRNSRLDDLYSLLGRQKLRLIHGLQSGLGRAWQKQESGRRITKDSSAALRGAPQRRVGVRIRALCKQAAYAKVYDCNRWWYVFHFKTTVVGVLQENNFFFLQKPTELNFWCIVV